MKNKTLVVLKHEFNKIVKTKTFIIMTILGPFLLAAIMIVPMYFSMKSVEGKAESLKIGIYLADSSQEVLAEVIVEESTALGWELFISKDRESLYTQAIKKEIAGYLTIEEDAIKYFTLKPGDFTVNASLQSIISDYLIDERLSARGLSYEEVKALTQAYSLPVFKISEDNETGVESDEGMEFALAIIIPMIFSLMIYMSILLYGQMIGRSVVTEKSSKVVDVLLSSVKPNQLMMGKIFGVGLAGMLQYSIWIFMALVALFVTKLVFGFAIPAQIAMSNFVYLGIYFVLGYLLYGSLFAAVGSASEDEQHLGQLSLPLILFLVVPIMLISAIIENPNSTLSLVFGFFPLTAPLVMLSRITTGEIPLWQIPLSIGSLALCIWFFIRLSAKIFKTGILMSGKNFKLREIVKWLR